jgi:hypothetical protein
MIDLASTVAPKSDQFNADDLIAGPRTITITRVSASGGANDQPVSIYFQGDNGKPYKPCKSMRRVLITAWGADGSQYAGRSMTLYRDPGVMFGGIQVGGIRISHMSHIDRDITIALTVTKAKRAPFTVRKLGQNQPTPETLPPESLADRVAKMLRAFEKLGVSAGLIERKLGHALDSTTNEEFEELSAIRNSLRDGTATIADWFADAERQQEEDDITAKLRGTGKVQS